VFISGSAPRSIFRGIHTLGSWIVSVLDASILEAVVVGAQWKMAFVSVVGSGAVGRLTMAGAELNMSAGRTLVATAHVGVGGGRSCHVDECLRFRRLDGAPAAMKL
jgi:hypothetical protein